MHEFEAEPFADDFARDVVGRRAEPAGDEDDFRARRGLGESLADHVAIGHRDLPGDAQAERKQRLGEKFEVGVEDIAEQQLGAGIDDFDAHGDE